MTKVKNPGSEVVGRGGEGCTLRRVGIQKKQKKKKRVTREKRTKGTGKTAKTRQERKREKHVQT